MKKMLAILLCCIFLFSCGTTVTVDFDEDIAFSQYNTYNYYPEIQSGLNSLDDKRIKQQTDSVLQARGWSKSESPQVLINFYASERLGTRNTIGIGVGSGGGNVGVGVSGGIPIGGRTIDQLLTFDIIDVEKDALIWQAKADGNYKENATPKKKQSYYQKTIEKILKKFPPKSK